MGRERMLAPLGKAAAYYAELEHTLLTRYPEMELVCKGEESGKISFRFYRKRKFVAYCDVYDGYFDVMTRFSARELSALEGMLAQLSAYARSVWADRYPCGTGAWLHYHVASAQTGAEALRLLSIRLEPPSGQFKPTT